MPKLKNIFAAAKLAAKGYLGASEIKAIAKYQSTQSPATCSACGFTGRFDAAGSPPRFGTRCPKCKSRERHRLFALAKKRGEFSFEGKSVLHFAPEAHIRSLVLDANPSSYQTSSYPNKGRSDLALNIENIELPDEYCEVVICSHVFEHVDDEMAMAEVHRILKKGGLLIAMVPIIEGWSQSYEDDKITQEAERSAHFGQYNHVRYYGADFRRRLASAGFAVDEVTALGKDSVDYRLTRGHKVFLARK